MSKISSVSINEQELLPLADLNLVEILRLRMQSAPQGKFLEENGLFRFSMGHPAIDGYVNGIIRLESQVAPEQVLSACDDFLRSLGQGFVLWIRDHGDRDVEQKLKAKGLTPVSEPGWAGMVIDHRLDLKSASQSFQICQASNNQESLDFATVTAAAFALSSDLGRLVVERVCTAPNVAAFVVYADGKPLAAAMVFVTRGIGGIYYVGTIPEARGKGLGELTTCIATNAGFDLGARGVILQSTQMGEPLYERLGYQTFTHYRWYRIEAPLDT